MIFDIFYIDICTFGCPRFECASNVLSKCNARESAYAYLLHRPIVYPPSRFYLNDYLNSS